MKISEVIERLQEIQEEHGDIETYYCGDEYEHKKHLPLVCH